MPGGLADDEHEYFIERLQGYIASVFDDADLDLQLVFVTFMRN